MGATIPALIQRHRAMMLELNAVLRDTPVNEKQQIEVDREGHNVLFELFAAPVHNMEEAAQKTAYLLQNIDGDLGDYFQEEKHIRALLGSFQFGSPLSNVSSARVDRDDDKYLSALLTTTDIVSVAYDMLVANLTYENDRTEARLYAETANQIVSILRAGREHAQAELGELAR